MIYNSLIVGVSDTIFNPQTPPNRTHPRNDSTRKAKTKKCSCRKSHCLKLYCECLARSELCGPDCLCINCDNHSRQKQLDVIAEKVDVRRNIVNALMQVKNALSFVNAMNA